LAAGVSLAMEAMQMFLPSRIASNVDLLTNCCGGLIGAMAAPLFAPTRLVGRRLYAWRHRMFRGGMAADAGFVIVCLWLLAQLNPVASCSAPGKCAAYSIFRCISCTRRSASCPRRPRWCSEPLALGLILTTLMRPAARRMLMIGVVVGAGAALKGAAAALAKGTHPFVWLTPGVAFGLLGGWLAIYLLAPLPGRVPLAAAAVCIVAATAAINLAPDNPYQNIPPRLIAGGASHYLSFSGIVRALSEIWPLLAILYLGFALTGAWREEPQRR
jgi:hypothetical protein